MDLIFTEPHAVLPAWQVTAATLPGIDDHFWDWMLWLAAKQQAGKGRLVAAELAKLHEHLLAPLGAWYYSPAFLLRRQPLGDLAG